MIGKPNTPNSEHRVCVHNRPKDDLVINLTKHMAYQTDRTNPISYDSEYLQKIKDKTNKKKISIIRKKLVDEHTPSGMILDMGCGDCSFIDTAYRVYGYDIIPEIVKELKDKNIYRDPIELMPSDIVALTCWDSLEHMAEPKRFLSKITTQTLYVSIPIIRDIRRTRQWKHYRPDEHFWYFECTGFIQWMKEQGFSCIFVCDDEVEEGEREDIMTFVLRREDGDT